MSLFSHGVKADISLQPPRGQDQVNCSELHRSVLVPLGSSSERHCIFSLPCHFKEAEHKYQLFQPIHEIRSLLEWSANAWRQEDLDTQEPQSSGEGRALCSCLSNSLPQVREMIYFLLSTNEQNRIFNFRFFRSNIISSLCPLLVICNGESLSAFIP